MLPYASSKAERCVHDVVKVCTPSTAAEFVAATDALIVTGPPSNCFPVVMSSALSLKKWLLPAACFDTRYIVFVDKSMTGVDVTPWVGSMLVEEGAVSPV